VFQGAGGGLNFVNANGSGGQLQVRTDGGASTAAMISFHRPGLYAAYLGLDTDNQWKVGGWSMGAVAYTLYHSGNFNPANYQTTSGAINSGNIGSQSVNYANSAGSVAWTNVSGRPGGLGVTGNWNWSGQGGQPPWLWGGSDGANFYVYNPSNFSVNYATTAGTANSVAWGNVSGRPTNVSSFNNDSGYLADGGSYGTLHLSNWFRSSGATGWYNETYAGGIYMVDSSWVRVYNSKGFWVDNNVAWNSGLGYLTTRGSGASIQVRDISNGLTYQIYVEGGNLKVIQV